MDLESPEEAGDIPINETVAPSSVSESALLSIGYNLDDTRYKKTSQAALDAA